MPALEQVNEEKDIAMSQVEYEAQLQVSASQEEEKVVEEVKEEAKEEVKLSEEEQMRMEYLQALEQANIKEIQTVQNLKDLMEMGYYNFKLNFNVIQKNNGNMDMIVHKLVTSDLSDSMFISKMQ